MREESGDIMQKLKKVAAVALMAGGIGLVGGGVANAGAAHCNDPRPDGVAINNLQLADCRQSFDGGVAFAPVNGATTGDLNQNIGNACVNSNAHVVDVD
ncbi:hypothetical protein [Streptomyces sp. GbtcB6]|uniref:hypothetical protein n=1 Tax=Streptomyces sp. GbtcB6 TaxID=2824751 RepID=UPI0027E45DC5|nr:hypothetical protein [Streptomyces sp. GbtcB6]